MTNTITSEATAHRAYNYPNGGTGYVYAVTFDGEACGYVTATDLPQARGMVRKALKRAAESAWNQRQVFDGDLEPGQVSRINFRTAMRHVADEMGKRFGT